jgi:uncharacterized coiled-coil protein SlyX
VNNVEERVTYLESRVKEQVHMVNGIREAMASLEARIDRRLEQFEQRMDQRFGLVEQRFIGIDARLGRMTNLLVGLLVAVIAGMGGIIAAILQH